MPSARPREHIHQSPRGSAIRSEVDMPSVGRGHDRPHAKDSTVPQFNIQTIGIDSRSDGKNLSATKVASAIVSGCALAFLIAGTSPASSASLSRSVDVNGTPAAVWAKIGAFCAIKDWHPAIGSCNESNTGARTRTLVTRDGKATFLEARTAFSDAERFYSYAFLSSPLPVTKYTSTFRVTPKTKGTSTVTWSSTYTPDAGKENDANTALIGIYESGLSEIRTKFAK